MMMMMMMMMMTITMTSVTTTTTIKAMTMSPHEEKKEIVRKSKLIIKIVNCYNFMPKLHVADQDQSRLSYSYKNLCNVY